MIWLYAELALFALLLLSAPYLLWCDYLAVMNLKRVRDSGGLSPLASALGAYLLARGYLLDFLVNTIHMTAVLREWPSELTVTKRLTRHIASGSGWRAEWCLAFRQKLLDRFDPHGIHQ